MKNILLFIISLSFWLRADASIQEAWKIFQNGDKNKFPQLVSELINEKMYFSSIPFLKEYLTTTNRANNSAVDAIVDRLVTEVGVKQFEVLPLSVLGKSNAPVVRYIIARKSFRQAKYGQALKELNNENIENWNPVKPFALLLEASILSVNHQEEKSIPLFKECVDVTESHIKKAKGKERLRQLKINRDYCIVGTPRSEFAMGKFSSAHSSYLDLDKSSYVWPEILFEEAWNSFYLKDYNRTLGKLVTYKAPVFNFIFNPEIEVLKALSYMELCLWDDTKNTVEAFYSKYEQENESYKKVVSSLGKDYRGFFLLMKEYQEGKLKENNLLNTGLSSISRDPAFLELYSTFLNGRIEIERIKGVRNDTFRAILNENLRESLNTQRNLIGSYVRGQLQLFAAQIIKAFEDMSYIKLEVLSKRKIEIYDDVMAGTDKDRKRGDVANLKRTDKQYFWSFNGEFWGDELGDYVFSLKSECK